MTFTCHMTQISAKSTRTSSLVSCDQKVCEKILIFCACDNHMIFIFQRCIHCFQSIELRYVRAVASDEVRWAQNTTNVLYSTCKSYSTSDTDSIYSEYSTCDAHSQYSTCICMYIHEYTVLGVLAQCTQYVM